MCPDSPHRIARFTFNFLRAAACAASLMLAFPAVARQAQQAVTSQADASYLRDLQIIIRQGSFRIGIYGFYKFPFRKLGKKSVFFAIFHNSCELRIIKAQQAFKIKILS